MRSRLLQSFLFVLGFWWLVTGLYWSLSDPDVNLATLQRITELFPWMQIQVPEHVNVLDGWFLQKQVLQYWSGPVILITLAIAAAGGGLVWGWALSKSKERAARVKSRESFRGVSLSLGPLPNPQTPPVQPIALRATDMALQVLTPEELAVLTDVLGLLAANRDCFAGDNQPAGSLLQRTLKATYAALREPQYPGPAALVAAASELGKVTAWKKDEDGAWLRVRNEEREAARLLAALPSWWELPAVERMAVLFAVKYRDHIELLPDAKDPAVYRLARTLLEQRAAAAPAPAPAAEEEKTKAYEQRDPEEELFEVFERELAMMPFQTMGLPKNVPAVAWKKGNRAFFLENRLTEHLQSKFRPELKARYETSGKPRIQKLTASLLKIFAEKGWLVCEHNNTSVPPNEALWVIQAGKLEFSRVLILDLPEEIVGRLPPKDSYYEVQIKRPLFHAPLASAVSKDDLMGGMLRPKSSTPAAEGTETSAEKKKSDIVEPKLKPKLSPPSLADLD